MTVGVPAYNNQETIAATIESIQAQTVSDIEIIISDDDSPDGTWEICREYEQKDARIQLFRQETNLYYLNFLFVLNKASSPYFVWLAGDDVWEPTFLEECIAVLDARPDAVCCVSRCVFISDAGDEFYSNGTAPLQGDWRENVVTFLRSLGDNTRMYGVYRVEALRAAFPDKIMHAYDWSLSAGTLKYGKHCEVPRILMKRHRTPNEDYQHSLIRDHRFTLFRLFPVSYMSIDALARGNIPVTFRTIAYLIRINFLKHEQYLKIIHPTFYYKMKFFYDFLNKHIIWRLE